MVYHIPPCRCRGLEVKRQLDVLDKQLAKTAFVAGNEYTIADMAIWPWCGAMAKGVLYGAAEFLQVHEYTNVIRWAAEIVKWPSLPKTLSKPHSPISMVQSAEQKTEQMQQAHIV